MKYARFILILIILMAAAHTARAAEHGYIIQADINDERLVCVPEKNVMSKSFGYYYAENEQELEDFCSNYDVVSYSEDCMAELFDVPNDSAYSSRWDASALNLPHMWDYDVNLGGVTVAIIDSGIASGHEDIDYDKILLRRNEVNDTDDVEDNIGHGTSVAGTIGSKRNNGIGVFGVASGVNMMIFNIVEPDGDIWFSDIIDALLYIYDNNLDVDVINMSLGGVIKSSQIFQDLQSVIDALCERGIIITAAVGNNGNDTVNYPAACEGVIGVGAIDNNFNLASFSQRNDTVFVTAPGESIYLPILNNRYLSRRGTSFSSPYVAAIAAYAKAVDKGINYDVFSELLKETALDRGDEGYDVYYGWGIVQPALLMDRLAEQYPIVYKDKVISNVTEENGKTTFTLKKCGRNYSIFASEYSGEMLNGLQSVNVNAGSGEVTAEIDTPSDGARLFIWDEFMRPIIPRE